MTTRSLEDVLQSAGNPVDPYSRMSSLAGVACGVPSSMSWLSKAMVAVVMVARHS